jgi:methionine synthase II (cobalamin-independent)
VVRRQAEAGIDVVSDGEFGKLRSWSFYVLDRLGGIEERDLDAPRGAGRARRARRGRAHRFAAAVGLSV